MELTMKKFVSVMKLTTVTLVCAALTGPVPETDAVVFDQGDAVLVIYGNTQQGYVNLGKWVDLKANGGTFDVSGILNAPGVSGANPMKYTVVGNNGRTPLWFRNNADITSWSPMDKKQLHVNRYNTALVYWAGQLRNANEPGRSLYEKTDPLLSFSSYLDRADDDTLNRSMGGDHRGSSEINQVLYLLERSGTPDTLTGATTAVLDSKTGKFTMVPQGPPAATPSMPSNK